MPNQYTRGPRRTVRVVVPLTAEEHARARIMVEMRFRATVVDVLRYGIPSEVELRRLIAIASWQTGGK